jgi:hypothetical protein
MIFYIRNSGHKGRYFICDEPIHVKGWSIALDGHKTHHEVFEGHFGLQFMPQKQGYDLKIRIGWNMQTIGDPLWGTYFLLTLKSFHGNARNNQPLHYIQ